MTTAPRRSFLLLAALAASLGGAFACNALLGIEDVVLANDGGPPSGEGGSVIDPTCAASPGIDPKVIRDACGIFASPSGNDVNDGTSASPVKSMQKAIALAVSTNKWRVYLCGDTYHDTVAIGAGESLRNLSLYGGLACSGWTFTGAHAIVKADQAGVVPLRVEGAHSLVTIDRVDFVAVDANSPGQSSVAGYLGDSTSVVIQNGALTAGVGVDGASAPTATQPTRDQTPDGLAGSTDPVSFKGHGGAEKDCTCTAVIQNGAGAPISVRTLSIGGKGGDDAPSSGGNGGPPTNAGAVATGGQGATASHPQSSCAVYGADGGGEGTPGLPGAPGRHAGDAGLGSIDGGWVPAPGFAGEIGGTGQGGGGGRGGECSSPAGADEGGGGGGCGGCGGTGGGGGAGGGASIALVIKDTHVSLASVSLTAVNAGNGGAGAAGLGATREGIGGPQGPNACGCTGGGGGAGGPGGNGGGGAGGISAGIVFHGVAPSIDGGSIRIGRAGKGGAAGGAGAAPGVDGAASNEMGL